MEKRLTIILICLVGFCRLNAQDFNPDKVVSAQGVFAWGDMTAAKYDNLYLAGALSYFIDSNICIKGEGFYFLSSTIENTDLQFSHNLFAGVDYYFPTGKAYLPYLGIQPGAAFTKRRQLKSNTDYSNYKMTANPLISADIGIKYYAPAAFYMFGEMKYVYGKALSDIKPVDISEIRLMFGLGFYLRLKKQ